MTNDFENKKGSKPLIPKPPTESRQSDSNVAFRRRFMNQLNNNNNNNNNSSISGNSRVVKNSNYSDSPRSSNEDDRSDHIFELLKSPIETRPLSRSKYSPLPQIGQKLTDAKMNRSTSMTSGLHATNDERDEKSILIGLRLPDGAKKQHTFSSKHKMSQVLEFALETKQPSVINKYTLLLMPNFVVNDPSKTLGFYKIENRSMLFVIEKSLID